MSTSIVPQHDNNLDSFLSYLKNEGRIVITEDGIDIFATQAEMAEYFGVTVKQVSTHISNYEKEAPDDFKDLFQEKVNKSGVGRPVRYYNSDILIYVGYRIHSTSKAIAFRKAIAAMFRRHVGLRFAELQNKLTDSYQVNYWLSGKRHAGSFIENSLPDGDKG